jgi:hypothetical protein
MAFVLANDSIAGCQVEQGSRCGILHVAILYYSLDLPVRAVTDDSLDSPNVGASRLTTQVARANTVMLCFVVE